MTKKTTSKKVSPKKSPAKATSDKKVVAAKEPANIKTMPLKHELLGSLKEARLANPFEQLGLIKNPISDGFL
ncbi:hypothetical protein, partial [Pseudoalteromonas sp. Q36-MNA-CIBAN-0048]|uniref:hypothetical protein n=1 Tax=Pseudoalteromonas sp. Q36-MNA-CIBAN-0048 TaxID=3140479 RepID=UPI00331939F8